jgi:AcrR family transcriptional regulator
MERPRAVGDTASVSRGSTPTPLQRQLAGVAGPAKPTPLDALRLGVRWFHAGRRLDIQALAAELGVSRMTLHRWVGTREQLLVEVLWAATDRALAAELTRVRAEACPGSVVAETLSRWATSLITHRGVNQLQHEENELFVRLTTQDASSFQRRLIERVHELLAEEHHAGRLVTGIDLDDLAFAVVRIVESFVHTQAITGAPPDPGRAGRILHVLLRPQRE